MPCACHKSKTDMPTDYTQQPDRAWDICGEKHFSAALMLAEEKGYFAINRQRIIGELVAASWHIFEKHRPTAEKLRDLRHKIQERKKVYLTEWESIAIDFEKILEFKIEDHLCDGEIFPDFTGRVFVFSNCEYPGNKKLQDITNDDLLIFINKARNSHLYTGRKVIFHRSPEEFYGTDADISSRHYYAFDKGKDVEFIPREFITQLKKSYDWNYPVEIGKTQSATTGYMVVKYLQSILPNAQLFLVNFGFAVNNSSYRCPWHNWKYEDAALKAISHIYIG